LTQGQVAISDIDKNKGLLDQTYLSDELKAQIAGTAGINATPAIGGTLTKQLANNATTIEKTDFIEKGKNLFNISNIKAGYQINAIGQEVANASYNLSEFIPVFLGQPYHLNKARQAATYDEDFKFVTYYDNSSQGSLVVTPTKNGYIRASIQNSRLSSFQMEKGSVETEYDSYKKKIPYLEVDETNIKFGGVKNKHVAKWSIDYSRTDFLDTGKNRFNLNKAIFGSYLDQSTGNLVVASNFVTSEFIRVEKGRTETISGVRKFVFYNLDKTYLSGFDQSQGTYTFTPATDGYIRFSYRTTDPNGTNVQMEIGNTITAYEDYYLIIPQLKAPLNPDELTITKTGNALTIESVFGEGKITTRTEKRADGNGVFNFIDTNVDGVVVHANNDDATPIRTFNTIGANHGYTVVLGCLGTERRRWNLSSEVLQDTF
jgi:hypothetical protein